MHKEPLADLITQAVAETIESLAFLEVTPSPEPPVPDENTLWVDMLVHDPVQGEFRLTVPSQLLALITETLYGQPAAEIPEATRLDLLAELLNTIAGRFLSELLPAETSFKLGLPTLVHSQFPQANPGLAWNFSAAGLLFSLSASGDSLLQLCHD